MMTNTEMNNSGRGVMVLLCAFLSVLLFAGIFAGTAAADSEQSNSLELTDEKTIEIEFAGEVGNCSITVKYSDDYFSGDAHDFSIPLLKVSLALAAASFNSSQVPYAESGPKAAQIRCKYLKTAYEKLGFSDSDMKFYNYEIPMNDTNDKVAYGIAKKEISINDEVYTLIAVQPRSGNYSGEWVSNFHIDPYKIGDTDYPIGFGKPAEEIYNSLKEELSLIPEGSDGKKKVKILISGFSRGAAVSNALAGELTKHADELGLDTKNIYAYTFATPNAVILNQTEDITSDYTNIHNTINPCDIAPSILPSTMNYGRYGIIRYFNYADYTIDERKLVSDKFAEFFKGEKSYSPYSPASDNAFLPVWFELSLIGTFDRDEYISLQYQYLKEIIALVFCGNETDAGRLLALNDSLDLLHPNDAKLKDAKAKSLSDNDKNREMDLDIIQFLIERVAAIIDLFPENTDENNSLTDSDWAIPQFTNGVVTNDTKLKEGKAKSLSDNDKYREMDLGIIQFLIERAVAIIDFFLENTDKDNSLTDSDWAIPQFTNGVVTIGYYHDFSWDTTRNKFVTKLGSLIDNAIMILTELKRTGYDISNITSLVQEHFAETYLSVLFSGISDDRLFAEDCDISTLHAVLYNTKGGNMADGKGCLRLYDISEEPILLENPEKEGYDFAGWINDDNEYVTEINVQEPGYTRVTALWEKNVPIIFNTAEIYEWNIDEIETPKLFDGMMSVQELPTPEDLRTSKSILLSAVSAEIHDSNLQHTDTPAIVYFSIPMETARYLAKLSPSYNIINHPEQVVLKSYHNGKLTNLKTAYDGYDKDTEKYLFHASTDELSSSFGICVDELQPPKKQNKSSQGTSIRLTATPMPTPTPEPTAAPTVVPLPTTPTPQSPVPFAGVLAGLSAAAVLFGVRRR